MEETMQRTLSSMKATGTMRQPGGDLLPSIVNEPELDPKLDRALGQQLKSKIHIGALPRAVERSMYTMNNHSSRDLGMSRAYGQTVGRSVAKASHL